MSSHEPLSSPDRSALAAPAVGAAVAPVASCVRRAPTAVTRVTATATPRLIPLGYAAAAAALEEPSAKRPLASSWCGSRARHRQQHASSNYPSRAANLGKQSSVVSF